MTPKFGANGSFNLLEQSLAIKEASRAAFVLVNAFLFFNQAYPDNASSLQLTLPLLLEACKSVSNQQEEQELRHCLTVDKAFAEILADLVCLFPANPTFKSDLSLSGHKSIPSFP